MTTYDLGTIKASITRTSSGYFEVYVQCVDGNIFKTMHSTEVDALKEILSYCETDDDEWIPKQEV